jgi:hypothetical protein
LNKCKPKLAASHHSSSILRESNRSFINIIKSKATEALASCKDTSTPGCSAIRYKLVKWAWQSKMDAILSLFQACLSVGYHPTIWKNMVAVAVLKPNKSDYIVAKALNASASCWKRP